MFRRLVRQQPMRQGKLVGLFVSLAVALVAAAVPSIARASVNVPWQSGMRAVGNGATIEPAVNDTDGTQTFLITPNNSPFYQGSANAPVPPPPFSNVSAPLYLVTYPLASTVDTAPGASPLNCYTEGFFTAQGQKDGAMNTRILTLDQLKAAQAAGDVTPFVDTYIYFDCSVVSAPVYMNATPLNFTPGS